MNNHWRVRRSGHSAQSGFTLVELLVVITIIGILIALLLPAVQAAREAARRSTCTNNLKQIALAVHGYHDKHNAFPQASAAYQSPYYGSPATTCPGWIFSTGHSWRVVILPYMEQETLYNKIDLKGVNNGCFGNSNGAWPRLGDPSGISASTPGLTKIAAFMCPSDPTRPFTYTAGGVTYDEAPTNYAGIWGDRARPEDNRGIFSRLTNTIANVTDGTSNTAMVGEVYRGKACNHVYSGAINGQRCRRWTEETGYCGAATGYYNGTAYVGLGPNDVQPDLITWTDMNCAGCFNNTDRRPISSLHPGGALCAYADASVHFVPSSVDPTVWRNTGSIAGGEAETFQ